MKIRILILAMLITAATFQHVFAGWVLTERGIGENQTVLYIQDNKIKILEPDQIQIFDLNKNMISIVNPANKSFWSGTPEEFASQSRKAMEESIEDIINRQMAWMSARQKETFRQDMLRQMKKNTNMPLPRVEVKYGQDKDMVAGYEVRKCEIWVSGQLRWEQWIAKEILIGKEFDVNRFGRMMRIFQSGFGYGESAALWDTEVTKAVGTGWPLRTVYFEEEGAFQVDEIANVEKKPLAGSIFNISDDYRRKSVTEIFLK